MSPDTIQQILIQLPIVAVFIYYTQYMNKQFQEFLRAQREEDRKILDRLATLIDCLDRNLEIHDRKTDRAITKMEERTRPRPSKKTSPGIPGEAAEI